MKIKFTLAALALGLGFGAMAHHTAFNSRWDARVPAEENIFMTTILKHMDVDGATGIAVTGGKLVNGDGTYGTEGPAGILGVTFDGKVHSWSFTTDEETGESVGTEKFTEQTYMRLRYNVNDAVDGMPFKGKKGTEFGGARLHIVVGPKPEGATKNTLTVNVRITSNKLATNKGGENKEYNSTFSFPAIELTDDYQHLDLYSEELAGAWKNQNFCDKKNPDNGPLTVHYIDVRLEDPQIGQWVAVKGIGFDKFEMPVLKFDHQSKWEACMTAHAYDPNEGKTHIEEPGTYFIQAEDIAPSWILGHVGHSEVVMGVEPGLDGYAHRRNYDSMWYEPDMATVSIHNSEKFNGGMGLWQAHGTDHYSAHASVQDFALIGMCQSDADFGTIYKGEYKDETSNVITKDQADKGFGAWVEYVFEMDQDGYLDLSLLAGAHALGGYDTVIGGGTRALNGDYFTKYNKDRSEGGYVVEGMDDDYLKTYGFSYLVYLDDQPLRTAWSSRPMINSRTGKMSDSTAKNPFSWTDTTEKDANGNPVLGEDGQPLNSYHLWVWPNYLASAEGQIWWGIYKDHLLRRAYDEQVVVDKVDNGDGTTTDVMGDSNFKKECLEKGVDIDSFLHPDFMDIPCEAGRHVIKVQSCGGSTVFDELKLRAKERASYDGIEKVVVENSVADAIEDANAPVEYFDLQGRKIANPGTGIYIVKQGKKVMKQVIR